MKFSRSTTEICNSIPLFPLLLSFYLLIHLLFLEAKLPYDPVCRRLVSRSVCWPVSHNFLERREVSILCCFRINCIFLILKNKFKILSLFIFPCSVEVFKDGYDKVVALLHTYFFIQRKNLLYVLHASKKYVTFHFEISIVANNVQIMCKYSFSYLR